MGARGWGHTNGVYAGLGGGIPPRYARQCICDTASALARRASKNHPKHMHALHLRVRERGDASADKGKTGRESKVFTTASGWSSLPHGTTEPHEVHGWLAFSWAARARAGGGRGEGSGDGSV